MRGADTDPWIPTVSLISLLNQDPGIRKPDSSKAKSTKCLSWWYYLALIKCSIVGLYYTLNWETLRWYSKPT